MPSDRRRRCTCCGRHDSEVGPISWRGNCVACAVALVKENAEGISAGHGPAHWRRIRGYERMVERARLDAAREST